MSVYVYIYRCIYVCIITDINKVTVPAIYTVDHLNFYSILRMRHSKFNEHNLDIVFFPLFQ